MKFNATFQSLRLGLAALALPLAGNASANSDTFATATTITSTNYESDEVSLFALTKEVGEPEIGSGGYANKTAWWKWTAPEDGLCTVDTLARPETVPVFDSVIGVFTGTSVNALTAVAYNDDNYAHLNGSNGSARCSFHAVAGTTYHIVVDGYSASEITINANRVKLSLGFVPRRAMRKLGAGHNTNVPDLRHFVTFIKTSTYGFSARVKIGNTSYAFKGGLSPEGTFTSSIAWRSPSNPSLIVPLGVLFNAKDGGSFYLWDGNAYTSSSSMFEVRSFPGTATTPLAGQFTNNDSALIERLTISSKGAVTAAGRAIDGTAYTYAGPLCSTTTNLPGNDSELPVMVSLHRGKGYLYHWLRFQEFGISDRMGSSSHYSRPANPTSLFYPGGFNQSASINFYMMSYSRPLPGTRALGFLNMTSGAGKLTINAVMGELATKVEELLTFSTANQFTFVSNVNKPTLKIDTRTGLVSGSVIDGVGKKRTLFGALSLDHNAVPRLRGWASGTTQNIRFLVD